MHQILEKSTPKELIVSRLTPKMEFRLAFLVQNVPWKMHMVYLERFRKKYLKSESETIYADLIRFLCLIIHPANHTLKSDIVQRWQLISSLFSFIKTGPAAQSAKLALFFDWLFYDSSSSAGFMNIGYNN